MGRGLPLLALLALGCASERGSGPLEYESSVATRTEGVAFFARGDVARVGMYGTTCDVYTSVGIAATDYDYPGEADAVLDAYAGQVLVQAAGDIWIETPLGSHAPDVPGVLDGRLTDDGLVALQQDGEGCFVGWSDGRSTSLQSKQCEGADLTVDRETGDAWVADGELTAVPADAQSSSLGPADFVVWDAAAEAVYAGTRDGQLRALEADGAQRWALDLEGELMDLTHLGTRGVAMAILSLPDGTATNIFVDGWSGLVLDEVSTPSAARTAVASPDGSRIALERTTVTSFFRVGTL